MISLEELKIWLEVASDDSSFDTVLTQLEEAAVAFVQRKTGRYFGPVGQVTERLRGSGGERLWLAEAPTSDPTVVLEYASPGADPVTIDAADAAGFLVRKATGPTDTNDGWLVRKGGAVWDPCREYEVTYQRGYQEGQEPADIRQVVIGLCALRWGMKGREGLRSEQRGDQSYAMPAFYVYSDGDLKLIPGAYSTIELWRRRRVL